MSSPQPDPEESSAVDGRAALRERMKNKRRQRRDLPQSEHPAAIPTTRPGADSNATSTGQELQPPLPGQRAGSEMQGQSGEIVPVIAPEIVRESSREITDDTTHQVSQEEIPAAGRQLHEAADGEIATAAVEPVQEVEPTRDAAPEPATRREPERVAAPTQEPAPQGESEPAPGLAQASLPDLNVSPDDPAALMASPTQLSIPMSILTRFKATAERRKVKHHELVLDALRAHATELPALVRARRPGPRVGDLFALRGSTPASNDTPAPLRVRTVKGELDVIDALAAWVSNEVCQGRPGVPKVSRSEMVAAALDAFLQAGGTRRR